MPFKVRRTNSAKGEVQTGVQEYGTGEAAYRAAMQNAVDFTIAHWDTAVGGTEDGPADDGTFKIYIKRKTPPVKIDLQYDWLDLTRPADDQGQTNNIVWEIVEV